jgi:SAM-dependent methyltransferase
MDLNESYWTDKYKKNQIGWDAGRITTPIKEYIDQIEDKNLQILVPGCGNGHEVKYLYDQGFNNVTVVDISAEPFKTLAPKCPAWTEDSFIVGDFFSLVGAYDLIIEQTFFCALVPSLRPSYADKMHELLAVNGKLAGVFFNIPLGVDSPPFGGSRDEYIVFFKEKFQFNVFDECYNSIKPREGNELFINLRKVG